MSSPAQLQKLTITAYTDSAFTKQSGSPFTVGINPEKYTYSHNSNYNKEQAAGTPGAVTKFKESVPETVSFELVFDGTGIAPASSAGGTVDDQITAFKAVTYNYNGQIHSPNYLKLIWGNLLFKCRLTSLQINYTLFSPAGISLRARLSVSFEEYIDAQTLALMADNHSPDLTHSYSVQAGDTLPLLCHRIYGNSKYYIDVAKANGLNNFRNLIPGTTLYFPQLISSPK